MDNMYNVLFSASFAEQSFNALSTKFFLSFLEDDTQKSQIEKLFRAFNRHGVSSLTVMQVFADWFQEGGFENG